MGRIINYRPRMLARLTVPILGTRQERIQQAKASSVVVLEVHPKHVRIESNDHNHADTCSLTADWTEVGVDPRMLDDAQVEVWMDNVGPDEQWSQDGSNLRFVGLTKEIEAKRDKSSCAEVTFEFVDFTTLFLEAKPFGSKGIPTYDMTLDQAWRLICSQTPGADNLKDSLVLEGLVTFPVLGSAVAERFKKLGKVPVHPDTDAWAVWQQCVGMLGLISYIRLDKCIVTTATNYYTESDAPLMVWGDNLEEWSEVRHSAIAKKGIGVSAFDPFEQRTLEALWPPLGDASVQHKTVKPTKKHPTQSEASIREHETREYFSIQGVTELAAILNIAKRIYEERSRQELEGHFKTTVMFTRTESTAHARIATFDLLGLHSGDTVRVEIHPDQFQILARMNNNPARVKWLRQRGYSADAANLIVKNMAEFGRLGAKFFVHSVTAELSIEGADGHFSLECHYVNRITIDGSTDSKSKAKGDTETGTEDFNDFFDAGFSDAFKKTFRDPGPDNLDQTVPKAGRR